jgi:DNA-binding MarR family transcriptional regulator
MSRATLLATAVLKKELAAAGVERVKPAYLSVLMTLWETDGLSAVELGRRSGLEPSTMTGLLDRMERDGIVARRPDPSDRRLQRIYLTAAGRTFRASVLEVLNATLAKATKGLSPNDVSSTRDFLRRVLTNLKEERRATP